MRKLSAFWMAALVGGFAVYGLAAPTWWSHRGVLDADPASDYSGVNAGQLKHVARMAYDELQTNLPGGAGATVSNLVFGFQNSNNYVAINLGQLKNVAAPFYDRLIAEGIVTTYPWTATAADDASYSMVNLGQLKAVFSFDLDADDDSLPDWWEIAFFGSIGLQGGGDDSDGDGVTNLQEFQAGTDPVIVNPMPIVTITYPIDGGVLP